MALSNIFEQDGYDALLARLSKLNSSTPAVWGKMNVAQMLAHVNVGFDVATDKKVPKYSGFMRFMLKNFLKSSVCKNKKPYPKNSRTAPIFIISDDRDFDAEMSRIKDNMQEVNKRGVSHYEGKNNPAFGKLSVEEWNCNMVKHLDHHLRQFGV